ncbi:MAG: decaprenyl-phosphate phosphoribosyltransferase [bacterium]|nr:decaprenyl-phosphate phosphoribosyltransferase [bacterium]
MSVLMTFFENLRPRQWTKNLLLFAGVIFARELSNTACVKRAILGSLVFCFSSGVVYVFNDIADRDLDRLHPTKRNRPIASGRLATSAAVKMGFSLLILCLASAWALGPLFLAGVCGFFLWNWLYTRWLKSVPVLDVTGIGMSFVIRATSGVLVLLPACPEVSISPWLLLCTFFLSLFLGFCKRRDEYMKMGPGKNETRPVLKGYSEPMLNAMIGVSLGLTMMMYGLYTVWPDTVEMFGTNHLIYTIPFVLLGMGRYLFLVYKEAKGGKPHDILLNDVLLQILVVGWIVTAIKIIGT